jgi:hypothetical protein
VAVDQALAFVEVQRRDGDTAADGDLADRKFASHADSLFT